jgi:hypothetical protein
MADRYDTAETTRLLSEDVRLFAHAIVEQFEAAPFRSWHPVSRALYDLARAALEADRVKRTPSPGP